MKLRKFQHEFLAAVENPAYDTVALSGPRSLGKTFLAAHVLARAMTPGDTLHQPGKEYVLGAASLDMARLTYAFIRETLEPRGGYRFIDSATRLGITHVATNTKLRAISSNAKTSFGLVNVPIVVLDEPGALETVGGQMLADSLMTAQGKVGSPLKLILIGTLAPMATLPGHWWYDLIHGGTKGKTWVRLYQGDRATWDNWQTIRKANPLIAISPELREKLKEERGEGRADTRLRARFLSYRLNIPSQDEAAVLLSTDDWDRVVARAVPERVGRPIVGCDLGGGRAWSAAVAVWLNGRMEAMAVAPGIPTLAEQEVRDRQPAGTYQRLYDGGSLDIADGLRVQPPSALVASIFREWGRPEVIIADRFRAPELRDCVGSVPVSERITRWSESSADIRALRKVSADGPLSCDVDSRDLVEASLSVAMVSNDTSGNVRLVKRGSNNTSRDDVSAALTLAAGAYNDAKDRVPKQVYHGKV